MLAQIIYSHQVIANQFDKSNPEPSSGITQSQDSLSKTFMIVTAVTIINVLERESCDWVIPEEGSGLLLSNWLAIT